MGIIKYINEEIQDVYKRQVNQPCWWFADEREISDIVYIEKPQSDAQDDTQTEVQDETQSDAQTE